MICQCTVSSAEAGESHGFDARDYAAPWCREEATTTIGVSFGDRVVHVWVCADHYAEYARLMEAA